MRFFKMLETGFLAAVVIAFILGLFNLIMLHSFAYNVYTPFVLSGFCILIYMNIRRQRIFLEKMKADKKSESKG